MPENYLRSYILICYMEKFNILASLCSLACGVEPHLVTNTEDIFSGFWLDFVVCGCPRHVIEITGKKY